MGEEPGQAAAAADRTSGEPAPKAKAAVNIITDRIRSGRQEQRRRRRALRIGRQQCVETGGYSPRMGRDGMMKSRSFGRDGMYEKGSWAGGYSER